MSRRRPLGIPAIIAAGIRRAEKERRAAVIARPIDRKSTRLNSSHSDRSRMPSSA